MWSDSTGIIGRVFTWTINWRHMSVANIRNTWREDHSKYYIIGSARNIKLWNGLSRSQRWLLCQVGITRYTYHL